MTFSSICLKRLKNFTLKNSISNVQRFGHSLEEETGQHIRVPIEETGHQMWYEISFSAIQKNEIPFLIL